MKNKRANIMWHFQIQIPRQALPSQSDITAIDKYQKTVVVIDVEVSSDSNIRGKEYEKQEIYQCLKEELERMLKVKAKMVPAMVGALRSVTPKLGGRLQQIPGTSSKLSAHC